MKEFSPKPDLWSKIQQRKDFDSQVKSHVPNLPQRMPKAELWNAIEEELDRKKPVIPLWKYGWVAAAIALILVVSGIMYLQIDENETESETPLLTEVQTSTPDTGNPERTKATPLKPEEVNQPSIDEKSLTENNSQKTKINREKFVEIEAPALEIKELTIENNLVSEIITPSVPEVAPVSTYHKVQISWGFQERGKLKTTFGSHSPEEISNSQTSRANSSNNSIKIKFQKN